MKGEITHEGVVQDIHGSIVSVAIMQTSGCGTCEASDSCHAAGLKEKRIDVDDAEAAARLRCGDHVQVAVSRGVGRKAVWLAFGLPLVLLAAGVGLNATGLGEGESLLIAVGALVVYYAALRMVKGRMEETFKFHIR